MNTNNSTYFTYWQSSKNRQWYFNYRGGNHERILRSEGYMTEAECQGGIAAVKRIAPNDSSYIRRQDLNSQWYFNMVSANHQPVATSESYSSKAMMEHSIDVVKQNAPSAPAYQRQEQAA